MLTQIVAGEIIYNVASAAVCALAGYFGLKFLIGELIKLLIAATVALITAVIGSQLIKHFKKKRDSVLLISTIKAIVQNCKEKMSYEELSSLRRQYEDTDTVLAEFDAKTGNLISHENTGEESVVVSRAGAEGELKKCMDENDGFIVLEE